MWFCVGGGRKKKSPKFLLKKAAAAGKKNKEIDSNTRVGCQVNQHRDAGQLREKRVRHRVAADATRRKSATTVRRGGRCGAAHFSPSNVVRTNTGGGPGARGFWVKDFLVTPGGVWSQVAPETILAVFQLTRDEEKDEDAEADDEVGADGVLGEEERVGALADRLVNLDEAGGVYAQGGHEGRLVRRRPTAHDVGEGNPAYQLELVKGKQNPDDAGRDDETIGGARGSERFVAHPGRKKKKEKLLSDARGRRGEGDAYARSKRGAI